MEHVIAFKFSIQAIEKIANHFRVMPGFPICTKMFIQLTMQVISRYDGQLLKQSHKTNNLSKRSIVSSFS